MYTPKKLRLNQFRLVQIPENSDYFKRFGFSSMPTNMYDSNAECPPILQDKLDQLQSAAAMLSRKADEFAEDQLNHAS